MKRKVIKMIFCAVFAALFALLFTFATYASSVQKTFDDELYGKVIRLHVIANSDSCEDQSAKLRVRDSVLEYISSLTADAVCAENACDIITESLDEISCYVKQKVRDLGYDYAAEVTFSQELYPVRYYDGFAFPSGVYNSLRIILGKGEGKNWWCILYPAVCTAAASDTGQILENGGVSHRVADLLCGKNVKFRFALLELFNFD